MMLNLDEQNQMRQQRQQMQRQPVQIRVPFLSQQTGLGDAIGNVTQAAGVKPCTPCQKRKEALNQRVQLFPW